MQCDRTGCPWWQGPEPAALSTERWDQIYASTRASDSRERLAVLIERVLAGELSAADAIKDADVLPQPTATDDVFDDVYHLLIHYREDEDICRKSPTYAAEQRASLASWIARLRS